MIIALQTLVYFRESLLTALDRLVRPYYKQLTLAFSRNTNFSEDEEVDDQVFAEFDDEKGVTFYPPMYAQRYAAVSDCLMDERWCGKLEKVVDFGYHDMSFIKYLKEVPGICCILGVDIETIPLRCSSDLLGGDEYAPKRESPLQITLFQGNAADPDYRLIGCDAVIAIEMIEHMLPHDLDRLVHTIFGFIKPWIVVFTTPNADFNVLFKALESNGLRRWDHLFEWTREQFHDWCSNIVVRYPQYTVTCQGIGPGPPGTIHYGCCSQLALFISKNYHKQRDLNLNSLALVAKAPSPNQLSEVLGGGWESTDNDNNIHDPDHMPNPLNGSTSFTEFLYPEKQSHMTLVISSTLCPSYPSFEPNFVDFNRRDKTLQCNLDVEVGKSFMMFDDEQYYNVVVPRRRVSHRVYEIGDVYSRLNCTTMQVKRFSKTTQNLMAKNKVDYLVHTREVVSEIRHLTKTLNFNKDSQNQHGNGDHIWCNINWGDNAPYWNQYYKIVREYNYPFETKSEEVRILDVVSDEINRLIDTQFDDEFSVDVNRLEISMEHLMSVVQHITDDVDRVRDLLEWNGYEIVDDVVIHSRLVVDTTSVATCEDEWNDNDNFSDWDATDVRSTTVSDGSTVVPDYHGRCLRRALDTKVRNLRTMLSADEDITTELDRVVCRLMKLALQTSRSRQSPPPSRWMQCKLLDLLTLTEKAIGRRKKHFIESYPVKCIELDSLERKVPAIETVHDQDIRVKEIVDEYQELLQPSDKMMNENDTFVDVDVEDDFLSTTSNQFLKDFEYVDGISPSLVIPEPVFSSEAFAIVDPSSQVTPLERTRAWLDEDVEVVPYPKHEIKYENSSGDTDHSSNAKYKHKKSSKKHKTTSNNDIQELGTSLPETSQSKTSYKKYKIKRDDKNKRKTSKTKITKNLNRKKSGFNRLLKNPENLVAKPKVISTEYKSLNVTATKPIPESLIKLCHPELKTDKLVDGHGTVDSADETNNVLIAHQPIHSISATEESFLIDIITQDFEETIALRRTIGTDSEAVPKVVEKDFDIFSIDIDENLRTKHEVSTENVQSQTIFLNDINEPSTSKGIRHNISMDVQCGPDALAVYPTLSASTSLVRIPQVASPGIKICNEVVDTKIEGADFSTSTQDNDNLTTITPRLRSVGIKIKDSDITICARTECATMTRVEPSTQPATTVIDMQVTRSTATNDRISSPETKLIKPVSSTLKIEDSGSEFNAPSIASSSKTFSYIVNIPKNTSDVLIEYKECVVTKQKSVVTLPRPKLCCGGVHVHSFKDKQNSEDIVYQGEWQKYRPKAHARKKTHKTCHVITSRKVSEPVPRKKENLKEKKVNSKEKVPIRRQAKQEFKETKKAIQMRNARLLKIKQEGAKANNQNNKPLIKTSINTMRIPRPIRMVTKVASKIAMSSVASKNAKSAYTVKRPAISPEFTLKGDNDKPHIIKKSYIPLYLKRTLQISTSSDKNSLNKSIDSANTAMNINSKSISNKFSPLVRSKTEEIKKDLLKFSDEVRENISYVIFRNDLEEKPTSEEKIEVESSEHTSDHNKTNSEQTEVINNRAHSPQSLNSSTCSSPNSIATVRAVSTRVKNISNRRHSTSSYKSSLNNSESENATPSRNKKVTKRCKSIKKADCKDFDNKENIPESTKNFVTKEKDKCKTQFVGRHKSVYIAQLKADSSSTANTLSRHKVQISNKSIKILTPKDDDGKQRSISSTVSKRRSTKSETSSNCEVLNQCQPDLYGSSESANKVLVLEPQPTYEVLTGTENASYVSCTESTLKSNNSLVAEWVNANLHSHANSIVNSMRQLLEETLDFIVIDHNHHLNSKTVLLSKDDFRKSKVDKVEPSGSKGVMNAVNENIKHSFLETDVENVLNRTFDSVLGGESVVSLNDTRLTVTDLDLLSFKSITSVSKYSEYFLADNEFNCTSQSQATEQDPTQNSSIVRDIFERKEPHLVQNTAGALANQAFSGFSINAEPVAGDQPDPVALIDSETGSLALDNTRQATSEELFISGRSSDSYASCLIEEDAVVPNWLFQIISQHHSVVEDPGPVLIGPVAVPLADPLYDANGNVIEPTMVGVGAGAGDGRGMHSDHSQDSSGRGTSLSSSDTSSGPQSDVSAILIDPSAFTAQFEMLRDSAANGTVPIEPNATNSSNTYRIEDDTGTLVGSHDDRSRTLNGASDIDADISSIDTDVPDSSDN